MTASPWLWAAFTVIAAAAQTVRNATQRELTGKLGTVGATHVRFLLGLPFACLFLIGVIAVGGAALPQPGLVFWPWVLAGALLQIAATALMLAAMGERSFVVAIAYIKTEPVQVALFGLIFLGDHVTQAMAAAILIATAGVVVMSLKPGAIRGDIVPTVLGLSAGACFALSAIGYRGAILSLHDPNYVMAATLTVTIGLAVQTALLTGWLASQFWFLAFAIATAASVRTLALVEVLFAQAISRFAFKQPVSAREGVGIVLIVIGVALLVWAY